MKSMESLSDAASRPFPAQEPDGHRAALEDKDRLQALDRTGLIGSAPEAAFDRIAHLSTILTGAPVSLISLVNAELQFFKAQEGLAGQVAEDRSTALTHCFCQYVTSEDATLAVSDARDHALLRGNKAVDELGVVAYLGVPLHGPDGHALGAICAIDDKPRKWRPRDVQILQDLCAVVETEIELRHALNAKELLLSELEHRLKNTFALVLSIVRMTERESDGPEEALKAIQSRILALSKAHDLIIPKTGGGARDPSSIELRKLLSVLLEPHVGEGLKGVTLDGPTMMLAPEPVTNFALVLHEFATNSVKYGALSSAQGGLEVSWGAEADQLVLTWRETGATIDAEAFDRNGFGSRLIDICVRLQLKGALERRIDAKSLTLRLTAPAAIALQAE